MASAGERTSAIALTLVVLLVGAGWALAVRVRSSCRRAGAGEESQGLALATDGEASEHRPAEERRGRRKAKVKSAASLAAAPLAVAGEYDEEI